MISRVVQSFRGMPFEERVALSIAIVLALLASVGQGVQFFTSDYSTYSTAMFVVIILSALAGIALTFEADVFPSSMDYEENHEKSLKFLTSIKHVLIVCGIEFVLGEVLFLIALATGAPGITGDISVILAPLLIGVLLGGMSCLVGTLVGFLVAWPLVKLVQFATGHRNGRPDSRFAPELALLFLTIAAFVILGTLGTNPPEVLATPKGRALYDTVYLYTSYAGTPPQQAMAWIARILGLVIVLVVILVFRAGAARKRQATAS